MATQAALLDAAEALFAARGVDDVRIEDVTEAADVAKGTFYIHFEDKGALARAVAARIYVEVSEQRALALEGLTDPALRIAASVCYFMDHAWRAPNRASCLLRMSPVDTDVNNPLHAELKHYLALGLRKGILQMTSLELGVAFVLGAGQAGMARVIDRPDPARARSLARSLVEMILRGLGLAPEAAILASDQAAARVFDAPYNGVDRPG